ncbi:MAG: hypothetical protein GW778_03110 [Alphaproteobacteria bacterium]|nr:hypothetical protein [Alphaproteobacteria bacterium]
MGSSCGNLHGNIEAAQRLTRLGLNQLAAANSLAAMMCAGAPQLARVFDANAACARLSAHTPERAQFKITETEINGRRYDVEEQDVLTLPHGTLKRFHVPGLEEDRSKVLEIPPMSGHPAPTILKNSAIEMIKHHDLYMFDWHDPRDVPLTKGTFDLNDYISYIVKALHEIGPNAHVVADCQPGVPLIAALSFMEANDDPCLPLSATFKGSPLNTAISPTGVNSSPQAMVDLFGSKDAAVSGFREHFIQTVSAPHVGEGQPVLHGSIQLANFYRLAPADHANARLKFWWQTALDTAPEERERHSDFYQNYDHVTDLPGEYLVQTFDTAFLNQRIADGSFFYTDPDSGIVHHVDPANISRVSTLVVEGRKDTITGLGQTADILNMMTNLSPELKRYRVGTTGHYGLFDGSDYRNNTRPLTSAHMREAEARILGVRRTTSDPDVDLKSFQYSIHRSPALLEARPEYAELAA